MTRKTSSSIFAFCLTFLTQSSFALDAASEISASTTNREMLSGDASSYNLRDKLSFSGVFEAESDHRKVNGELSSSGITVATVELSMQAALNSRVSSEIVLLYEDGDTRFATDIAVIHFSIDPSLNNKSATTTLTVGRTYLPFGTFESNMVNDTLILALAETNKTVVTFGADYEVGSGSSKVTSQLYAYNSDTALSVDDSFGLRFAYETDAANFGVDYVSNIIDSGGFTEFLEDSLGAEYEHLDSAIGAVALHAQYQIKQLTLLGEAISISRIGADNTADATLTNQNIKAYQFEMAYEYARFGLALAIQTSHDGAFIGLPKNRLSFAGHTTLFDEASIALELSVDEDYSLNSGGTSDNTLGALMQFGLEF